MRDFLTRLRQKFRAGSPRKPEIASRQIVIRRNWRFSIVPGAILAILVPILCWEILRQNVCRSTWPWTITLLGVAPAATLTGIFASLLIAREQFARSMRPNLSWSCQPRVGGDGWVVRLANFGPGPATIEAVKYDLAVTTDSGLIQNSDLAHDEATRMLSEINLREGEHYSLELITPGAPLPVVKQIGEGFEFAELTTEALKNITRLNFSVSVVDIMGDLHRKALPYAAGLPDIIKNEGKKLAKNSNSGGQTDVT